MISFYFPFCLFLYLHFLYDNIERSWFNLGLAVQVLNYQHSLVLWSCRWLDVGHPLASVSCAHAHCASWAQHVHALFPKPCTSRTAWSQAPSTIWVSLFWKVSVYTSYRLCLRFNNFGSVFPEKQQPLSLYTFMPFLFFPEDCLRVLF